MYAPGSPCWVDIGSPNIDEAASFYQELFGWNVAGSDDTFGGYRTCELDESPVAGIGPQQNENQPPWWMTYFSVEDIVASVETAKKLGAEIAVESAELGTIGKLAVLVDPTGAVFSLWQPGDLIGAHIVNEPGALAWHELTTRDAAASIDFYQGLFGWDAETLQIGDNEYVSFALGAMPIAGMTVMGDKWPVEAGSQWMVYFTVENPDESVAVVEKFGGEVCLPPTDSPIGRFAVCNDPHGATFSMLQIPNPD
jgi:uncharacterized protein